MKNLKNFSEHQSSPKVKDLSRDEFIELYCENYDLSFEIETLGVIYDYLIINDPNRICDEEGNIFIDFAQVDEIYFQESEPNDKLIDYIDSLSISEYIDYNIVKKILNKDKSKIFLLVEDGCIVYKDLTIKYEV